MTDTQAPKQRPPAARAAQPAAAPTPPAPQPGEADIVDSIVAYLVELMPGSADLKTTAGRQRITEEIRAEFGGREYYVRARPETARAERVRLILSTFNGRNAREVARRLGIGRATVYRVLKQAGKV